MRRVTYFLSLTLFSFATVAQDVFLTSLEVRKGFPSNEHSQVFSFKLAVLADVSSFTYNLDNNKSVFTKVVDDTGFDLLAAQNAYEKKNEEKGYAFNKLKIEYRAPISSGNQRGIIVASSLGVTPAKGAKVIRLQGVVAMINLGVGEKTYMLNDIPTEYEWGDPGVKTEIGRVIIQESGSFSFNDVEFTKYWIKSEMPVTSVNVTGGDDRAEAIKHGVGLESYEIVFKNLPEKLNLVVTATNIEIKEIPFDIEVMIGF